MMSGILVLIQISVQHCSWKKEWGGGALDFPEYFPPDYNIMMSFLEIEREPYQKMVYLKLHDNFDEDSFIILYANLLIKDSSLYINMLMRFGSNSL